MQAVGDGEVDRDGDIVQTFYPKKSTGHIEMGAVRIDADIGAIGVVAVQCVLYADITAVTGYLIDISVGVVDRQGCALLVECLYVVYVLAKFVGGISSGRT